MKRKRKIKSVFLVMLLLSGLLFFPVPAKADAVTDYISVAVGYPGMELWEYVEVGDYHWSELASSLPVYEQTYSYYNNRSGDGREFTAVVDSARGILLMDFLQYANIYYGDIYNLQFYVVDHNGIQAAFDRDILFQTRYYFEDYNGHLYREYDDNFNVMSVDSSECWNYCYQVEPMLALEDNWVNYTEEFEHALPDFEYMTTANRFRLLFGQTFPEESMTNSSAKYVRTIYVTLVGKPQFGEMPELDGSYGSHEVSMTASVHSDVRSAVSEFVQMHSTNEDVLQITDVTVTPDDFYTDLVHITISYDIVGEGDASITASYGSAGIEVAATPQVEGSPDPAAAEPSENPANTDETKADTPTVSDDTQNTAEQNTDAQNTQSTGGNAAGGRTGGNGEPVINAQNGAQGFDAAPQLQQDAANMQTAVASNEIPAAQIDTEDVAALASADSTTGIFRLSKDVQDRLDSEKNRPAAVGGAMVTEPVTQVLAEDHTEEKEARERMLLIFTGIGTAGVIVLGGIGEKLAFFFQIRK